MLGLFGAPVVASTWTCSETRTFPGASDSVFSVLLRNVSCHLMLEREEVEKQKQCFMCDYIEKLVILGTVVSRRKLSLRSISFSRTEQGKNIVSPLIQITAAYIWHLLALRQPSLPVDGFLSSIDGFKEGGRW